nr:hypothetical protein [Thalassotalea loyana]
MKHNAETSIRTSLDGWLLDLTFEFIENSENYSSVKWFAKSQSHAHIELVNWHKFTNAATLEPIHLGTIDTTNRELYLVAYSHKIGDSCKVDLQILKGGTYAQ